MFARGHASPSEKAVLPFREILKLRRGASVGTVKNVNLDWSSHPYNLLDLAFKEAGSLANFNFFENVII